MRGELDVLMRLERPERAVTVMILNGCGLEGIPWMFGMGISLDA